MKASLRLQRQVLRRVKACQRQAMQSLTEWPSSKSMQLKGSELEETV